MKKNVIHVPEGTQWLAELVGRELKDGLPRGIFNKSVCGCGATNLALTDGNKTILCSPRVRLLENKRAQCEDMGIEVIVVKDGVQDSDIGDYLAKVAIPKILVTYDSLPRVAQLIKDKEAWRVVVDEFHVLLSDSGFKSEVELRTLECLSGFPYVTYVSATPMLDDFVEQIPQFKDLPYTELVWQNPRKIKVERIKTGKPMEAALDIIKRYQQGQGFKREINGKTEVSRECVIFLNSVKGIVNLIANSDLQPEEVNIIIADTKENARTLRFLSKKMGREYEVGVLPKDGEPHKLVTLCTSTAYAGCDFYSTSAATFVVCDSRSKHQIVDIGTELMQIAGRQRKPENKFRDIIFFIYRTSSADMSQEEFEAEIQQKRSLTDKYILMYDQQDDTMKASLKKALVSWQQLNKYSENYAMWDESQSCFVFNLMA